MKRLAVRATRGPLFVVQTNHVSIGCFGIDLGERIVPTYASITSGVVGNATIIAREMAKLGLPPTDVRCEFMDEDDRITVATLLEIELGSCGFDIRHRFSPPSRICVVGCRDRKTDRVAIGPSMSSRHCVAWRSIAGGTDQRPRHLASAGARRVSRF